MTLTIGRSRIVELTCRSASTGAPTAGVRGFGTTPSEPLPAPFDAPLPTPPPPPPALDTDRADWDFGLVDAEDASGVLCAMR
jgi:hypothetical protein